MTTRSDSAARRPGERAGLDAERVLEAARDLVVSGDAEPLSMRRLADHLGVAPNTLYSYFPSKAALMDAVLDSLIGDIEVPDLGAMDWRDGLVAVMDASRTMLLQHRDLLPMLLSRPMRGPNVVRLGEQTLALLARGGLEGATAVEAMRSLLMLTIGWVVIEAPRQAEADPSGRHATTEAAYSEQQDAPRIAALAEPLSRPRGADAFETSIRWLIDGFGYDHADEAPKA